MAYLVLGRRFDVLLLDEEIFAWSLAAATLTRCWRRRGYCARDVGLVGG
jgi:hypothetical protein